MTPTSADIAAAKSVMLNLALTECNERATWLATIIAKHMQPEREQVELVVDENTQLLTELTALRTTYESIQTLYQMKVKECQEMERKANWVWNNCQVLYWPDNNGYPIEHNPMYKKDSRDLIESAMNKEAK